MKSVVIENPIQNSPYAEPRRHFRFSDEGITNEIAAAPRTSSYFVPILQAVRAGDQQSKRIRVLRFPGDFHFMG